MPTSALGDHLAGILRQLLGLRKKIQSLGHLWIGFGPNLQAFFLSEHIDKDFALDVGSDPGIVFQ